VELNKILNPRWVILTLSCVSVSIWVLTPLSLLQKWNILHKATLMEVAVPAVLANLAFLLGSYLHKLWPGSKVPTILLNSREMIILWSSGILAIAAISVVFVKIGLSGFSFHYFSFRAAYVDGVTTLMHLSTFGIVYLVGKKIWVGKSYSIPTILLSLFVFVAVARGTLGAERLALFIPILALIILFFVRRGVRLKIKSIVLVSSVGVLFLIIFSVLEYYRTYGVKVLSGADIGGPISYGLERLQMYYATAVNSGASELSIIREGKLYYPPFMVTLQPIAQIISFSDTLEQVFGYYTFRNIPLEELGMYTPEFNNRWGLISPFFEGYFLGALFWLIWGFVGQRYYSILFIDKSYSMSDGLAFSFIMVGFIDSALRVNLLSASHLLLPLFMVFILKLVETKGRIRNP